MNIVVRAIGPDLYADYGRVPEDFLVESMLECDPVRNGLAGIGLREVAVPVPYRKYYPGEGPRDWTVKHDLTKWEFFLATVNGAVAAGAVAAPPGAGIIVTEGRSDTAALWDIRVEPRHRRCGIGTALLHACADWARARSFRFLGIETQNTNVPACRFYVKSGCELLEIRRFGYAHCPEVSEEVMLIWRLRL